MKQNKIFIYGKHAVSEALLHAPQAVRKVHLAQNMDDRKLRELIKKAGVPTEPLDERKATSQAEGGSPHQGVIALISLSGLVTPFEKFIETFEPTPETCLVFLSEVQDPHNVGAIIRSAAAFGARAVLLSEQNQAGVTGAVIKASAGAAFSMPLVVVPGTQQALSKLKKVGVKIVGLAGEAPRSIHEESFTEPALFVFGNEAHGIAPAAKALCEKMISIPISPRAESLNVAAAAAVVLYAWSTKHTRALQ
jgi:23S rRNA (guanosine2251-2'-O)-methyltransferase